MLLADKLLGVDKERCADAPRRLLTRLQEGIRHAQRLVVSAECMTIVGNLAFTTPSRLVSTVPLARAPFPLTWIEFRSDDRKRGAWNIGSGEDDDGVDNGNRNKTEQIGFLLREKPDSAGFTAEVCWSYKQRLPNWFAAWFSAFEIDVDLDPSTARIAEGRLTVEGSIEMLREPGAIPVGYTETPWMTAARSNERELEALCTIHAHAVARAGLSEDAKATLHPIPGELRDSMMSDTYEEIPTLLAILAVLNSRNLTRIEEIDNSELNRRRARMKRPPLLSHNILQIAVSEGIRARSGAPSDATAAQVAFHLCRGHFKVRKTGIFWWSAHLRGDAKLGMRTKDYHLDG